MGKPRSGTHSDGSRFYSAPCGPFVGEPLRATCEFDGKSRWAACLKITENKASAGAIHFPSLLPPTRKKLSVGSVGDQIALNWSVAGRLRRRQCEHRCPSLAGHLLGTISAALSRNRLGFYTMWATFAF